MRKVIISIYSLIVLLGCKETKNQTADISVIKNEKKENRPNIVFILADDLGYTDLGYAGSDLHQTPNLDALASQSISFTTAHSAHPTCQPSRLSLMTGKTPSRLGAISHGALGGVKGNGIEIPSSEITLGTALQKGGYTTSHIGKWHIGTGENEPKYRGFDFDVASNDFCCPGSYFYPYKSNQHQNIKDEKAAVPDLSNYDPKTHLTEALSNEAAKFIKSQKGKEKPFFLNLWYYAVHTPIQANKDKVAKYKKLIKPENQHRNANYAALVEHLDDGVGTVLKALEENGMADNTIVIFMSDNGGAIYRNITVNYPLRGGKGMFYEGGTRVPFLVRWPGVVKPGSVNNERVAGWDIYPTVLSMANIKGDPKQLENIDGVDLTPLIKKPSKSLNTRSFNWIKYVSLIHYSPKLTERNWPGQSIIKDNWKLIEYFEMPIVNVKQHYLLFNLNNDPNEEINLADKEPEKLNELKKAMMEWSKEVKADKYSVKSFYEGL